MKTEGNLTGCSEQDIKLQKIRLKSELFDRCGRPVSVVRKLSFCSLVRSRQTSEGYGQTLANSG